MNCHKMIQLVGFVQFTELDLNPKNTGLGPVIIRGFPGIDFPGFSGMFEVSGKVDKDFKSLRVLQSR